MQRLFGACTVLALVILISITGFVINTDTAFSVQNKLTQSSVFAQNGDIQKAKEFLTSAKNEWSDNMETMLLFVSHGKLDRIEEAINTADSYINNNQISLYLSECSTAQLLIDHFRNLEYPNINNIF